MFKIMLLLGFPGMSLTVKFQAGSVEPITPISAPIPFLTWSWPTNVSRDYPQNLINDLLMTSARTGSQIFKAL